VGRQEDVPQPGTRTGRGQQQVLMMTGSVSIDDTHRKAKQVGERLRQADPP
jgi:hypothetical protein